MKVPRRPISWSGLWACAETWEASKVSISSSDTRSIQHIRADPSLKRCHPALGALPRQPFPCAYTLTPHFRSDNFARSDLSSLSHRLYPPALPHPTAYQRPTLHTPTNRSLTRHLGAQSMPLPQLLASTGRARPPPTSPHHRSPPHPTTESLVL